MSVEFPPMLCASQAGSRDELGGRLNDDLDVAEGKFDGWRLITGKRGGEVFARAGRNNADYTGRLPLIEGSLRRLGDDTVLDGEIVCASGLEDLNSAMRTERPYTRDNLQLIVFDVLMASGTDLRSDPWSDRRTFLDELAESFDFPRVRSSLLLPVAAGSLDAALAAGLEGLVVKRRSSRYARRPLQRSAGWVKIKPQQTCEARVVGFKPGKNSWVGLVGALEFELLDGPHRGVRSSCSGFDMTRRVEITEHQADWLGAIITIKHHGFKRTGVPTSPQFLTRRYDLEEAA